jgi:hypothetical protein
MFECSSYSAACTPRQEILICQLCCGKWLPFGLVRLEGSQAQYGAPSLLCTAGAAGYIFELSHLPWNSFFGLYFNDCHRVKFPMDYLLYFELLCEKLFLFFMQLGFFFIKPLLHSKLLTFDSTVLL